MSMIRRDKQRLRLVLSTCIHKQAQHHGNREQTLHLGVWYKLGMGLRSGFACIRVRIRVRFRVRIRVRVRVRGKA